MKYLIGDIHGCYHTLHQLIDEIEKQDSDPFYLFLGDYVDRGLHSYETIEFLIDLAKSRPCDFLRGNHDDVVHYITTGETPITNIGEYAYGEPNRLNAARWLTHHGLNETYDSYLRNGVDISDFVKSTLPQHHLDFFRNLKPIHIENEWFACHAWFSPIHELPREEKFLKNEFKQSIIWGRFAIGDYGFSTKWDGRRLYVGHTPTINYHGKHEVFHTHNFSILDTGSFIPGGALTAYCPMNSNTITIPTLLKDTQ